MKISNVHWDSWDSKNWIIHREHEFNWWDGWGMSPVATALQESRALFELWKTSWVMMNLNIRLRTLYFLTSPSESRLETSPSQDKLLIVQIINNLIYLLNSVESKSSCSSSVVPINVITNYIKNAKNSHWHTMGPYNMSLIVWAWFLVFPGCRD
jgi:hypothetical protein